MDNVKWNVRMLWRMLDQMLECYGEIWRLIEFQNVIQKVVKSVRMCTVSVLNRLLDCYVEY